MPEVIELKKFADMVEKYLIRSIVLILVLIVLVQGLMTRDPFRVYLSWGERLEGQRIEYPVNTAPLEEDNNFAVKSPYALLTISVDNYSNLPNAVILVNKEEVQRFTDNEVTIKVMAGDIIEIDSTFYNIPVKYRIKEVSDNVASPEKGTVYDTNGGIEMIGKIIVK